MGQEGFKSSFPYPQIRIMFFIFTCCLLALSCRAKAPSPKPWPEQFHAEVYQVQGTANSIVDIWYDWPKGRNLVIIQHQLSYKLHDVEWTNGTSYYFDLEADTCFSISFPVGILSPDWLIDDAHYLGVKELDGFTCNVWEKADFIIYYEDVESRRPVAWLFLTSGQFMHIITFDVGAALSDDKWQSPAMCFTDSAASKSIPGPQLSISTGQDVMALKPWERWLQSFSLVQRV